MNAKNYDAEMLKVVSRDKTVLQGGKPKLLLHACCAPCASSCLERLNEFFAVTVLYYNPNIQSGEYERRKAELLRLLKETNWADFVDCDHDENEFYERIRGLENCPEGGNRCEACFRLRLERTAQTAAEKGFRYFATTLTVSPLKNADTINRVGYEVAENSGALWLPSDFKKRNGYLRGTELCRRYGLYRQNYCGCEFSKPKETLPPNA